MKILCWLTLVICAGTLVLIALPPHHGIQDILLVLVVAINGSNVIRMLRSESHLCRECGGKDIYDRSSESCYECVRAEVRAALSAILLNTEQEKQT